MLLNIYCIVAIIVAVSVYNMLANNEETVIEMVCETDEQAQMIKNRKVSLSVLSGVFWPVILFVYLIKK